MNLSVVLAAFCIGLGFGHFAATIAIVARYAIPRAPGFYHAILAPFMLVSGVSVGAVAISVLTGNEAVAWAVVYVISEFVVWWGLVSYSIYYQLRGKHRNR